MIRSILPMAVAALLAGCAATTDGPLVLDEVPEQVPTPTWRETATEEDQARIDTLPHLWDEVLRAVPRRHRHVVTREGDLLDPEASLPHPAPPPGSYACRLVRIGAPARRDPPARAFPSFFCHVAAEGEDELFLTKQTGSELPGGWLYQDGPRRLIFLGASQREKGDNSLTYQAEPDRDLAGVVERVAPFRWRLVLPPRGEASVLDVYELVPALE